MKGSRARWSGDWSIFSLALGPPRSGIGRGSSTPLPRWLLNSEEVTSAVPGGPETPWNRKSGLVRPLRWQDSQEILARAA